MPFAVWLTLAVVESLSWAWLLACINDTLSSSLPILLSSSLKCSPTVTSGRAASSLTWVCRARRAAAAAATASFWARQHRISLLISFLLSWIAAWYSQADAAHILKGASSVWGFLNSLLSSLSSPEAVSSSNLRLLTAKCWSRMLWCEVSRHCLIHSCSLKVVKSSLHACNLIRAAVVAFSLPAWTNS